MRCSVSSDDVHIDDDQQAEQIGLDRMSVEDLKKFNKNKNLIKKFAKKYDAFLASDSLIKQVQYAPLESS